MSSVMVPSGSDREAEAAVMAMRFLMVREPIRPGAERCSYIAKVPLSRLVSWFHSIGFSHKKQGAGSLRAPVSKKANP